MQHEYLNEQEIAAIERFNADTVLREAVKKVVLEGIYLNGTLQKNLPANPKINAAYYLAASDPSASSEKVGELVKAMWQGLNFLEVGFNKLSEIKAPKKEEPKKDVNKAR